MSAHSHTHDHQQHGDEDPYYLDQLCMVGLSAAFGGICLALYSIKSDMLERMLDSRFHAYVLASGIALLALAGLRALCLWNEAKAEQAHVHDHAHDHHHDHGHEHDHGHDHGHEHHHHDPGHDHAHAHGHHHEHGHDHDHGWAPWRYVVLLIPVIFFLLGLPNKGPSLGSAKTVDTTAEAAGIASFVGDPTDPWSQMVLAAAVYVEHEPEEVVGVTYRQLMESPDSADMRNYLKDKTVAVKGLFKRSDQGDRFFHVARFLRQCCTPDAMQVSIPVKARDSITGIADRTWVTVTGKVQFGVYQGRWYVALLVSSARKVVPGPQDQSEFVEN